MSKSTQTGTSRPKGRVESDGPYKFEKTTGFKEALTETKFPWLVFGLIVASVVILIVTIIVSVVYCPCDCEDDTSSTTSDTSSAATASDTSSGATASDTSSGATASDTSSGATASDTGSAVHIGDPTVEIHGDSFTPTVVGQTGGHADLVFHDCMWSRTGSTIRMFGRMTTTAQTVGQHMVSINVGTGIVPLSASGDVTFKNNPSDPRVRSLATTSTVLILTWTSTTTANDVGWFDVSYNLVTPSTPVAAAHRMVGKAFTPVVTNVTGPNNGITVSNCTYTKIKNTVRVTGYVEADEVAPGGDSTFSLDLPVGSSVVEDGIYGTSRFEMRFSNTTGQRSGTTLFASAAGTTIDFAWSTSSGVVQLNHGWFDVVYSLPVDTSDPLGTELVAWSAFTPVMSNASGGHSAFAVTDAVFTRVVDQVRVTGLVALDNDGKATVQTEEMGLPSGTLVVPNTVFGTGLFILTENPSDGNATRMNFWTTDHLLFRWTGAVSIETDIGKIDLLYVVES
jgi:hypothetical protein